MDLPPDKAKLLKQYDDTRKWDIICDQVYCGCCFDRDLIVMHQCGPTSYGGGEGVVRLRPGVADWTRTHGCLVRPHLTLRH